MPPLAAPRTMLPCAPMMLSRRLVMRALRPYDLPGASSIWVRSSGTALANCTAVISRCCDNTSRVLAATSLSQALRSPLITPSSCLISCLRSRAAMLLVHAAKAIGAKVCGRMNMVRRIANSRNMRRSWYRACRMEDGLHWRQRIASDRYTVAGSVACSANSAWATASGVLALADGFRQCRWARVARRCWLEMRSIGPPQDAAGCLCGLEHSRQLSWAEVYPARW